jgi:hypothetical protein
VVIHIKLEVSKEEEEDKRGVKGEENNCNNEN